MEEKSDALQRITSIALDIVLVLVLLAAGLGVRSLYVEAVVFPPLDDPAFYLTSAENLISKRALEVDVLWSYQLPNLGLPHPSHEHWMPLTTGLIAAAFALMEPALVTGQLPGLILGAMLAPFTYLLGRRALPGGKRSVAHPWKGNRWLAFGAALLVVVNASLSYQSASADSSAPFALLAAWALAAAIRRPGDQGGYFGAGLLIALAYLTRADGLLLLLAVPLAWWLLPPPRRPVVDLPDNPAAQVVWDHWPRESGSEEAWKRQVGPRMVNLLDMAVAFAIPIVPWLARNYLAFGTLLPSSLLGQAWLNNYIETFNYLSHPTWETLLAQGWPEILAQRGDALLHNSAVFLQNTFPWGLLALPGLWLLRREWAFFPPLVYGTLLFLVTAIVFPVSSVSGTFYHSLGAIVPFMALAAVYAVNRIVRRALRKPMLARAVFIFVTGILVTLSAVQMLQALQSVTERHQAEKDQFEAAAGWLAQNANPGDVIMTTQPYTLNYASGHPAIVLPGSESPDAAWEAAQRYNARFLIITQSFGQYPAVLQSQPDPRFHLLEATETSEFYEIIREQP